MTIFTIYCAENMIFILLENGKTQWKKKGKYNMNQWLYEVLINHFITEKMFEDQDLDKLLDEREVEEFEKQWLKCC